MDHGQDFKSFKRERFELPAPYHAINLQDVLYLSNQVVWLELLLYPDASKQKLQAKLAIG